MMRYKIYILTIAIVSGLAALSSCKKGSSNATMSYIDSLEQDSTVSPEFIALTKNIMADSGNPENFYQRSKLLVEQNKNEEALNDISKAVELSPDNPLYLTTLGDVALLAQKGSVTEDAYQRAIRIQPDYFDAYHKLGDLYLAVTEYLKAELLFKKLLDLNPNDKVAYLKVGLAKKYTGDTTAAIEYFKRASSLDNEYAEPSMQLGIIYLEKNDPQGLRYFENALRIDEFNDIALYNYGLLKQQLGFYEDAMKAYQKVVNINPSNRLAFHNMGYINILHENYEESLDYFEKAIRLDPDYYMAYYHRGVANEQLKDYNAAESDFKKALEINPDFKLAEESLYALRNSKK